MAGDVRQTVNIPALEKYLVAQVEAIASPISLKQFNFGESNPTYLLTSGAGQRFVLRKKPPGKLVSPTAHNIAREYRILHALQSSDVPVPKTYTFCEDASVIGTPFYIMEFLDGRIFEDPSLPGVTPSDRTAMWKSVVEALARLHKVDYQAIGLQPMDKGPGFFSRQLKTFKALSQSQAQVVDQKTKTRVGELPHFPEMERFFSDLSHHPRDRSTLIHGDYKIDNVVFHKTEPRVIGILDWEMAAIGHPLSDFTNLTQPYLTAAYHSYVGFNRTNHLFRPGALVGLPTREQCVAWYGAMAGWQYGAEELSWGDAFGAFRLAVVFQGIAARFTLGQSGSAKAEAYGAQRGVTADWAWDLICALANNSSKSSSGVKL